MKETTKNQYGLPPRLEGVPVYCYACGVLSHEAAGLDAEKDLVCPSCECVDAVPVDVAEDTVVQTRNQEPQGDHQARLLALLGYHRDDMPEDAVQGLQDIAEDVGEVERAIKVARFSLEGLDFDRVDVAGAAYDRLGEVITEEWVTG